MPSTCTRNTRIASIALAAVVVSLAAPREAGANRPVVVVFNVEDRGVGLSRTMLTRLSDFLAMQLAATGSYQLVPRDKLRTRLTEQKKASYKACYDQSCQIQIGRELAAQKSLATSVMKLGTRCMVTVVLYDLQASASEGGASADGRCDEDGVVEAIQAVVGKLVPRGTVSAPKASQPADKGGLLIKTRPTGATVKIDGVEVKGRTPLTLTELKAGEHLLEITKDDFRYTGKVKVTADSYSRVDLTLEKARVQLEVISEPPEATISLNGTQMGKTPRILPAVRVGEHLVELRKDGYLPEAHPLRLGSGTRRQTIRFALKRAAVLKIASDPPGAAVELDDGGVGRTPVSVQVAPGRHKVSLRLAGRAPITKQVQVAEGEAASVMIRMELSEEAKRRQAAIARHQAALAAHRERYAPVVRKRRSKTIRGCSALGAGAAMVVAASVLYGLGASQGGDAHAAYEEAAGASAPSDLEALDQHRSEVESARSKMNAATVLLGLGAAGIGYAVYELITRPSVPEAPTRQSLRAVRAQVGFAPGAAGGAVTLSGRF